MNGAEPGRRSLLTMLAAFAGLTLLVVALSLAVGVRLRAMPAMPAAPSGASREHLAPDVAAFLGPLAVGDRFGTWRVAQIPPAPPRSLTLELEGDHDERFVVDVRTRSPGASPGVAETTRLAIYVRSSHPGAATSEAAVRACTALAAALRAREDTGHAPPALDSLPPAPN